MSQAKGKRHPHRWGDTTVEPGQRQEVRVTVSESYAGTDIRVPVYVWRGVDPGPVVFVTAAVHGDEINGTGTIRQLILDQPFRLRAGTLILVPVVNIFGFERYSRYLPDRRDLNRCFPGSPSGSLASRMARTIFEEIVTRCDFGIDLHTAAVRRTNFPNVRADMKQPRVAEFARAFGAELIVSGLGPQGALRREACKAGCSTLIFEAGEVWKVEPSYVEYAQRGIRNCLIHLGMVRGKPLHPPYRVETDASRWIRAQYGGFLRFHVGPGEIVEEGAILASNTTLTGQENNTIRAPRDGIVLGMTTMPSIAPGDPVCHLAFPRDGALPTIERAVGRLREDSLHRRFKGDLARSVLLSQPKQPDGDS